MNGEKVNEICICRSGQGGNHCRVYITNRDLLQFCMIPVIDRLASEIGNYASYVHLRQNVKISNVFVMGVFLLCRYQRDYKFLEDFLLTRLGKINYLRIGNVGLHSIMNGTQVRKVDAQTHEEQRSYRSNALGDNTDKQDRESLARIALSGSIMYGTNPRNRLFERFASRSYGIKVTIPGTVYTDWRYGYFGVWKKHNNRAMRDILIAFIRKGSYLTYVSPDREGVDVHLLTVEQSSGTKVESDFDTSKFVQV